MLPHRCRKAKKKKGEKENENEKVICSIVKTNGTGKAKGIGYIVEDNLFVPAISKENKLYIRVLEDVVRYCHPVIGKQNEFSGYITQAFADVPVFNKEKDGYEIRDYLEIEYFVWYKYAD